MIAGTARREKNENNKTEKNIRVGEQDAVNNATSCRNCPQFYWPDPVNQTDCLPITPTLISYTDAVVVVFAAFTVVGILSSLVVLGIYVRHNNARIIKATSRELSYMMLAGVVIQVRHSCMISSFGLIGATTMGTGGDRSHQLSESWDHQWVGRQLSTTNINYSNGRPISKFT